ncbi:MAG TPA: VTT domain-containing protein, partial [Pyrinomonadaceae bacterium]|nr:VTT domain-containing protein [Pyrinomonadaceae bacterium]
MNWLEPILHGSIPDVAAGVLFLLFFFATFVSEDAVCLLAGSAAASGRISFVMAVTACFLGIFVGDILLYLAGRQFGNRVFESRAVSRLVSDETVKRASEWLRQHGAAAVFTSRFVSGLRLPTYLAAGALRTDFLKFSLYFLLASAIWTPLLVGSVAFSQSVFFSRNALLGVVVAAVVLKVGHKYTSKKNRRLLTGRFKRIYNWEFWPLYIFYIPVAAYVLLLSVRHRSLTVFTAANPAISAGGFKGESKHDIYECLGQSAAARKYLLRHTLLKRELPKHQQLLAGWRFVDSVGGTFPIVLKPNAGERGKGVQIIRSLGQLDDAILKIDEDVVLQEFAPGIEASIFYFRRPDHEYGQIFSITEKRFPTVTGDGASTLEELILNDDRAVCLAKKYLEHNREALFSVPTRGHTVRMIDIGTHSRGAVFLDGDWIKTDVLEKKIDEICRGFKGFYFGRFDIRAASFEDLMRGENFKIVELNGVTSESTNIYDPRYGLLDAYR